MDGLKTTETALNVNTLINNIPEGNIKKDSIVILELMKKVTNESPKIWGNNSIIGFGNYSYFRKNNKTEFKWFNIGFAPRKNKITILLAHTGNMDRDFVTPTLWPSAVTVVLLVLI